MKLNDTKNLLFIFFRYRLSMCVCVCVCVCIYIYIYHHVVPRARISLTLSRHFSLSFIASGRSSGLHPVSSHSCWMYVRAGHPAFARPYVGVHRSRSLMSSSLLLQQCPVCLVHLTWIVFVMGGWWPYSWCFVGCCRQNMYIILTIFFFLSCFTVGEASRILTSFQPRLFFFFFFFFQFLF